MYANLPDMGGYQEIGLKAQTLPGAKKETEDWIKNKGALDVTIKLYFEGDISHQWDFKSNKWVQYE